MNSLDSIRSSGTARSRPLISLHASFVLTGMITTLLGPILPSLSLRWRLDDFHAGLLFTAQFAGSIAGVLLSSVVLTRRGFRPCLALGFLLMGIGAAALGSGPWLAGMAAAFVFGLGLGLSIPATNLLVAERNPARSSAALSLLNLAWGAGAVCFPFFAAAFLRLQRVGLLLNGLAIVALLFALWFAFGAGLDSARAQTEDASDAVSAVGKLNWPALAVLGLLFFLYVGTENGLSGWLATYTRRTSPGESAAWAIMPSFFWGALLLGRLLAPLFLREGNEIRVARYGLLAAAFGGVIVVRSAAFAQIAAGAGVAGLGLAAVFPITIARFSACFGRIASRFVGLMFALAGFGGATIPWLVGFASSQLGSLRYGLWLPVICCLAMFGLYLARTALRPAISVSSH